MHHSKERSGEFVIPGECIGVIEEFIPGSGTYAEGGVVHSKIIGRVLLDILNKEISVYPLVSPVIIPQMGNIVAGQVLNVSSKRATIRIMKIEKTPLSGFFTGLLHVSEVSSSYVESMFEACKAGDVMRAKVVSNKNRTYHLSTVEKNLGVTYAFCSWCGHLLNYKRRMFCPSCGKTETRKVASDYGQEEI